MIIFLKRDQKAKEPILLKDLDACLSKTKKQYGDLIKPVFCQDIIAKDREDFTELLGLMDGLLCYQAKDPSGKILDLYGYNKENKAFEIQRTVNVPTNILYFDCLLLMQDRNFSLVFTKDRLALKLSILQFDNVELNENILTLPEVNSNRYANFKYCMCYSTELLVAVRPTSRVTYSSVNVDLVSIFSSEKRKSSNNQSKLIKAKLLDHKEIQVPSNSKLLDCELVCNGKKLILIFDSPSNGKLFVCCSTQPLSKLFTTKIVCDSSNGWFFLRDESSSDLLMTITTTNKDISIQLFSFVDDRTFILVKEFKLSSLFEFSHFDMWVCVSNCTMFCFTKSVVYVVDYFSQVVKFVLQMKEIELSELMSVNVVYNGFEVIVSREFVPSEEMLVDVFDTGLCVEVFFMPDLFTLFGLSRISVLKTFSAHTLETLPIPKKIKVELVQLKTLQAV